jgi:succinate dehydrogenase / fumarate reductase membrane anchor subunit
MVDRIVTGAHYGLLDWLLQRISAAIMATYAVFMAAWLLSHPGLDYNAWTLLFSSNVMRSFTLLVLLALFYHAWVGMRDIAMDYVKPAGLRFAVHTLVALTLFMYAIWSVQILWGMQ